MGLPCKDLSTTSTIFELGGGDHGPGREDGVDSFGVGGWMMKMGQGIWLDVLRAWAVGKSKVKSVTKQWPASLSGIEKFGGVKLFQISVVSPDQKGYSGTLEEVTPFLKGHL